MTQVSEARISSDEHGHDATTRPFTIEQDSVPLLVDPEGVARVVGTRVTLDTVVNAFEEGASAEEIVLRYPSLRLADVYAVLGYYLRHLSEVNAYLEEQRALAEKVRRENEARFDLVGIRERLMARSAEQQK